MVAFNRSGLLGTALVVAVVATCARLGLWQLDRLEQRREHNAAVSQRIDAPPLTLAEPPSDTSGLMHRRVELQGVLDHGRSIVLRGRTYRGMPGVHVITPLRMSDGSAIPVNRGWLPAPDGRTVDLNQLRTDGMATVSGLALPFPLVTRAPDAPATAAVEPADSTARAWLRLDGGALGRSLPYPLASFYVQALGSDEADAVPVRLPPPELGDGPHLSYAVQWFGFAAVAFVGLIVVVLRRSGAGLAVARPERRRAAQISPPDG